MEKGTVGLEMTGEDNSGPEGTPTCRTHEAGYCS